MLANNLLNHFKSKNIKFTKSTNPTLFHFSVSVWCCRYDLLRRASVGRRNSHRTWNHQPPCPSPYGFLHFDQFRSCRRPDLIPRLLGRFPWKHVHADHLWVYFGCDCTDSTGPLHTFVRLPWKGKHKNKTIVYICRLQQCCPRLLASLNDFFMDINLHFNKFSKWRFHCQFYDLIVSFNGLFRRMQGLQGVLSKLSSFESVFCFECQFFQVGTRCTASNWLFID